MCGRFSLTAEPDELARLFDLPELGDFPPRYNIAPTQPILTVGVGPAGTRQATLVRWGLIPQWVKDPSAFTLLINARSETAATKASFRAAMRHRRVLVPASGFYEWHRPEDRRQPRQPYWITPSQPGPIAFAGLVETWMGPDGSEMDTGCILTTESNARIGNIHHRMLVVVRPGDFDRWLDCLNQTPADVNDLLQPVEDGFFEAIPVGSAVNKVANSGPEIQVREVLDAQPRETSKKPKKPDDGQMDLF